MSSPIIPTRVPTHPSKAAPTAGANSGIDAFAPEQASSESAFSMDVRRGGPPPEVLEQIAAADTIYQGLSASGKQLRFVPAGPGESTEIELRERNGSSVRTLSVSEAFEIACGKPVE
jgi:hypothetical protein